MHSDNRRAKLGVAKPRRNDPCPCSSGRKYKHCCGAVRPMASAAAVSPQVRSVTAELERARALREAGDLAGATALLQSVVQLAPGNPVGHCDLGLVHLHSHRLVEATRCFERAVGLNPRDAIAHYNLGVALDQQGRDGAAIVAYRRALSLNPKLADAHERLGNLLLVHEARDEALDCFRRVTAIAPNSALGRLNRAKILHEGGKLAEAEGCLRDAIARDPSSSEAHRFLGNVLRELGRFDEAIRSFNRAIGLKPDDVAVHYDLIHSKRLGEAERPLVAQLLSLLNGPSLVDKDRAHLHFALGKAYDDLADYEQAIRHFDDANRIARRGVVFDRAQFAVGISRLIASFTRNVFEENAGLGTDRETPILVLGMMRSGTTLVEQILSSHPRIGAGGELGYWHERAEAYARDEAAGLTRSYVGKLADDYASLLDRIAPGASRVTDKMPGNFLWIGLIHLAFPNARIILAGAIRWTRVCRFTSPISTHARISRTTAAIWSFIISNIPV